ALGLDRVNDGAQRAALAGRIDGASVRVELAGPGVAGATVRVEHDALPPELSLSSTTSNAARSMLALTGSGLERLVHVEGPTLVRHVLLDGGARDELLRAVAVHGVRVQAGAVVVAPERPRTSPEQVETDVRRAVDVAKRLSLASAEAQQRLATIVRRDPSPPIRRTALALMTRHAPRAELTAAVCTEAIEDRDERVAILAAIHADARARILEVASSTDVDAEARADALVHLAAHRAPELGGLLTAALRDTRTPVARATLELLRVRGTLHDPIDELVPAIVHLAGHEDDEVANAAIELVGAHGAGRDVAPLRSITSGPFAKRSRTKRVEAAVAAIQARVGPEELGALAVVEADGQLGALSVADDRGELSLTTDERGALSDARSTSTTKRERR
ncbi:hypothetical protein L6R52_40690, partial [Myxococcota bacterium]|nr:hypothetical protein [Myxococcota bacterium]